MGEMYLIPRFMGYCLTGMNYKYGYHKNAKPFIDPPIIPVELSFKYDFNEQRIELVNKIIKYPTRFSFRYCTFRVIYYGEVYPKTSLLEKSNLATACKQRKGD